MAPSAAGPNGTASNNGDYNAADIAILTALLTQQQQSHTSDLESVPLDDLDIAEELRRLEAAQGIAEGVENRLDGLIGNLDKLLETLQGVGSGQDEAATEPADTPKPQYPASKAESSLNVASK